MAPVASSSQPTQVSRLTYANDVLDGIGAPKTQGNLLLVLAWMQGENTNAKFNPLATTQPAQGATVFNTLPHGGHVWNYPDYSTGVSATITTLLNGRYNGIVNDLRAGTVPPGKILSNNPDQFATWGTGASLIGQILRENGSTLAGNSTAPVGTTTTASPSSSGGGSSFLENVGKFVLEAPINPISAASGLFGFTNPLDTIGKKIVYASAIAGGGLTILVGLILVGVDLGIASKAAGNAPPVRAAKRVRNAFGDPSQASDKELRQAHDAGKRQGQINRTRKAGRKSGEGKRVNPSESKSSQAARKKRKTQGDIHPETGDDIPF